MNQCVIVVGAPWEGLELHGPFSSRSEAEKYQSQVLYMKDHWWIMPLKKARRVPVRVTRYGPKPRGTNLPSPVLSDTIHLEYKEE